MPGPLEVVVIDGMAVGMFTGIGSLARGAAKVFAALPAASSRSQHAGRRFGDE